jgi:hypothetical protein
MRGQWYRSFFLVLAYSVPVIYTLILTRTGSEWLAALAISLVFGSVCTYFSKGAFDNWKVYKEKTWGPYACYQAAMALATGYFFLLTRSMFGLLGGGSTFWFYVLFVVPMTVMVVVVLYTTIKQGRKTEEQ